MQYTVSRYSGFEIRQYTILDSTNEEAKRTLPSNQADIVVTTDIQTSGKGRGGNKWISDEGNLFFSIITDISRLKDIHNISYIAALSVVRTLSQYGITSQIKWPNDVLMDGRKICGILPEKHKNFLITGIGINMASHPEYLESGRVAGSLSSYDLDKETLLQNILKHFHEILSDYEKTGFTLIRAEILKYLYRLNEEVELEYLGRKIKAVIKDISPGGNLIVENAEGRHEFVTGEIFNLG